jgi:predicted ArsR family transcriptional regulator
MPGFKRQVEWSKNMDTSPDSQSQSTRHKILRLLKLSGPQSVKDLARTLAISSMGIRQNLISLEAAGWVRHYQKQRGVGRPGFVYALTEKGDEEHFPRTYASETISLLEAVQDLEGDDGLKKIFERRTEKQAAGYRARISSEDLEERVSELAVIRTEQELFHQVLEGADVTRERHILSGDLTCTYAIRRRH